MRTKSIHNLLLILILAASIVISLPVLSFASTQAVNDAAANTKLTNIYNRLGNMYDRMAATNAYLSNIQTYTNNSQAYEYDIRNTLINYFSPIAGDTLNGSNRTISQQIYDLRQLTAGVGGQTADVSSKLITTNNYLSSIDSKSKDYTQYIDGLENEISNINWISLASGSFIDNQNNIISTNTQVTQATQNNYMYKFTMTPNLDYGVLWFRVPCGPNTRNKKDINIVFYDINNSGNINNFYPKYSYAFNQNSNYLDIYVTDFYYNYLNIGIRIQIDSGYVFYASLPIQSYYISSTSEDFVKISDYIFLKNYDESLNNIDSNLQVLKDVYASPDVIAAKQQQQAYEDQAITDFTGSGSAAASGSDTTNMKNVSGAIKSGLDSGGSVNGALGVFNTSGGLWDWFSQSNYDEINGSQTRSHGSDEYIDFYNTNREELERLLQEER